MRLLRRTSMSLAKCENFIHLRITFCARRISSRVLEDLFWSCIVLLVRTSLFNHSLDADEAPFQTTVRDGWLDGWMAGLTIDFEERFSFLFVSLGLGIA